MVRHKPDRSDWFPAVCSNSGCNNTTTLPPRFAGNFPNCRKCDSPLTTERSLILKQGSASNRGGGGKGSNTPGGKSGAGGNTNASSSAPPSSKRKRNGEEEDTSLGEEQPIKADAKKVKSEFPVDTYRGQHHWCMFHHILGHAFKVCDSNDIKDYGQVDYSLHLEWERLASFDEVYSVWVDQLPLHLTGAMHHAALFNGVLHDWRQFVIRRDLLMIEIAAIIESVVDDNGDKSTHLSVELLHIATLAFAQQAHFVAKLAAWLKSWVEVVDHALAPLIQAAKADSSPQAFLHEQEVPPPLNPSVIMAKVNALKGLIQDYEKEIFLIRLGLSETMNRTRYLGNANALKLCCSFISDCLLITEDFKENEPTIHLVRLPELDGIAKDITKAVNDDFPGRFNAPSFDFLPRK